MVLPPEVELRAQRAVLENAVAHGGAAKTTAVVARLLATDATLRPRADEVREFVSQFVATIEGVPTPELSDRLDRLGGPEASRAVTEKTEGGVFPDLPGAIDGKVVLRMAPFPNGVLHIGHGRLLFVHDYYRTRYHGKILLVFDDTIGSVEKRVESEFFDLIQGDCELAGVRPDSVLYKSDRIEAQYPWARRVIEKGGAYVCRCPAETLRENRVKGAACPERAQTPSETMDEWERMLGNAYGPGEAVLRLRTDLADPDPAFRDRVLFRISDLDHPRVGRKYSVWPMLEFSWAVDDVELGVTHVLRGKELVIEDRMQQYIWDLLGVNGPPFLHWGLLRVREAKVAKSKANREVRSGLYDGWADPRTWSLRSLDRRGISMEALRTFILSFGLSLADIEVAAETLYSENRKRIDVSTVRRAYVEDPVPVDVEGYPFELSTIPLPNHPDRPELGERPVRAGPSFYLARKDLLAHLGEEVRLKDLVNIRLPAAAPALSAPVRAEFTSRENRRLTRLQWVGRDGAVPVDILSPDGEHSQGLAERAVGEAQPRDILQFERVGFVRIDGSWPPGTSPVRAVYGHP
ncbi:MAG TPA: glutamate--tRNA ligase [Thermoplasmata archaeon]|nr:glutamate--tRNA ligase [Thermoplasmata archaeon]